MHLIFRTISIVFVLLSFATAHAEQYPSLSGTQFRMERIGRIQNKGFSMPLQIDIVDKDIYSPKSVRFSADGRTFYINSLEGGKTVVYSWPELKKLKTISHKFTSENEHLFYGETTVFDYPYFRSSKSGNPNHFVGKPVESELSHGGRFLWVPYYRRDFDSSGQSPSAVAIIDTRTNSIVRVMPTGPIPKYVAASPDGRYVAVIHWGDNTVGIIDTSSGDPARFKYISHLVVENQLSQEGLGGQNRDSACGFCLRGSVFSPNGEYLLVARMGKGGVAGFHIPTQTYLGTVMNIASTPRHLALSPDGQIVYASSNVSGYVSKVSLSRLLSALETAKGKRINGPDWHKTMVGKGARTLDVSPDGKTLYVAVNNTSELVAVDAESMLVMGRIGVDQFAVGLAVAPDGRAVLLTSQGRDGVGGNSVNIIAVSREDRPDSGTLD